MILDSLSYTTDISGTPPAVEVQIHSDNSTGDWVLRLSWNNPPGVTVSKYNVYADNKLVVTTQSRSYDYVVCNDSINELILSLSAWNAAGEGERSSYLVQQNHPSIGIYILLNNNIISVIVPWL